jgi:histidine ammonia-lyase
MGMAAAYKCRRILDNACLVVGAEFLCGVQGIEFHRPLRAGAGEERLAALVRGPLVGVAPLGPDRPPAPDLERLAVAVRSGILSP